MIQFIIFSLVKEDDAGAVLRPPVERGMVIVAECGVAPDRIKSESVGANLHKERSNFTPRLKWESERKREFEKEEFFLY